MAQRRSEARCVLRWFVVCLFDRWFDPSRFGQMPTLVLFAHRSACAVGTQNSIH